MKVVTGPMTASCNSSWNARRDSWRVKRAWPKLRLPACGKIGTSTTVSPTSLQFAEGFAGLVDDGVADQLAARVHVVLRSDGEDERARQTLEARGLTTLRHDLEPQVEGGGVFAGIDVGAHGRERSR